MSDNNGLEAKAPVARTESVGSLDFRPSSKEEHKKSKASLNNQAMEDSGEVKFSKDGTEGKGDAAVEIGSVPQPFAGMGKDELMKYANDPFWVRLRWFLFILFWLAWLGMLAAAIAIIILAPKCPAPAPLEYWQKSPLYQVLPHTFQKSDDGKFDLNGIKSRLDHMVDLGTKVILLSSIFKSSKRSHDGYDTTDFKSVDPALGSLDDFKGLIEAAHSKDLKIVLEVVPNHSSEEHEWFQESIKNNTPYNDYYVWRDCASQSELPNNWLSLDGSPAWTYNEDRKQCYLHQLGKGRPDFNFHIAAIHQELFNDTLQFWLNHGVTGFRIGAVQYLYEDSRYEDEPQIDLSGNYSSLNHTYTVNHPKNLDALTEIRKLLDTEEAADGQPRILLTDTDEPITDVIKFYGSSEASLADIPLNFQLIKDLRKGFSAKVLDASVKNVINTVPKWAWPNWVLSNSKNSRSASRLEPKVADALALVQMTLPGTPVVYYGEEIGMEDAGGQEPACGEMNWDAVESQRIGNNSRYSVYKSLATLRKANSILYGDIAFVEGHEDIFAFTRIRKGSPGYLVVVNIDSETRFVNFENQTRLPDEMIVEIRSAESTTIGTAPKDKVHKSNVTLAGYEGLVLSFVPEKE